MFSMLIKRETCVFGVSREEMCVLDGVRKGKACWILIFFKLFFKDVVASM